MSAAWVRCEADAIDGGVCLTRNPVYAECQNAAQHVIPGRDPMSAEYTPTTEHVRQVFQMDPNRAMPQRERGRAFDRWLAAHDAEVAARALRDAADAQDADPEFRDPLRLKSDWLRDRADQIEDPS